MLAKTPFLIIIFLLLCCRNVNAQYVTIPDTNFVNCLNNHGYSSCMNGNQLDTTCSVLVNATSIDCSNASLYDLTGIEYFDNLSSLTCDENHLTSLPVLPNSLTYLSCENNQLTSLNSLPPSLTVLYCGLNQLTSLPSLPPDLNVLFCDLNQLTALPSLPTALTDLYCDYNSLTSLPSLPTTLNGLNCSNNSITALPTLPGTLTFLSCNYNSLDSLPPLPALMALYCSNNSLTALPTLPSTLIWLNFSNNSITSLPSVPNTLTLLSCTHNSLTSLPHLPAFLSTIYCGYNSLTSITNLPNHVNSLYINNNPGLTCLPPIAEIHEFFWDSTAITCLPNTISITGSADPSISTVPICTFFNNYNCDVYWNIGGTIYNDSISNCNKDSLDPVYSHIKMNLYSNGNLIQQTFSNSLGQFIFDTDTGTYLYTPDTNAVYNVVCPISGIQTSNLTALDSIDTDMDFALECKPGFDIGVTSILRSSGIFRPAGFASVKIAAGDLSNQFGLHCASGVSGEVKVLISGPASFISPLSGALTPTLSGDTLIYAIADFGAVDFNSAFGLYVQTDTTAQLLQQICFQVWITPTIDNDSTNNNLTQCFNVVNSYDPNDKEVSPAYIDDAGGEWLTYTIRFQNTGNAPAYDIYILDTLSQFVDASSFQLMNYSHEPFMQIMGSVIRFNFTNINLTDSITNEPASHGYVQYKVKSLQGLAQNTTIENTAYIYFDFNVPVVTNTATSLVHCLENLSVSQTICNGESYLFNSADLTFTGIYLDTIQNINGCDTIVYLNLNVTQQTLNTSQNGNTLNVLTPGVYQWINCNGNTVIPGQTGNSFTPLTNGNYAVSVTNVNCVDTSACINFIISSIESMVKGNILLSPNPANEMVCLENLPDQKGTIIFYDVTGRKVLEESIEITKQYINIAALSKGTYVIAITTDKMLYQMRCVKN